MKKSLVIIFSILLAKWAFSCTGNKQEDKSEDSYPELSWSVENLNRECPAYIDNVGYLSKVELDREDNRIDYVYRVNDDVFSGLSSDINYKDIIKITKIQLATNVFQQRKLIEETIKDQVPFRIIFKDNDDSRQIVVLVSVEELKEILNQYPTEKEVFLELLRMDTEKENKKCPSVWEDGIRTVSTEIVNIDGQHYINYDYEIDEQIYQLFLIEEFVKEFQQETDSNINRIVNSGDNILIMARADCGYRYNYFSKKHNKNFVFAYPASKMKSMIQDVELRMALKEIL